MGEMRWGGTCLYGVWGRGGWGVIWGEGRGYGESEVYIRSVGQIYRLMHPYMGYGGSTIELGRGI